MTTAPTRLDDETAPSKWERVAVWGITFAVFAVLAPRFLDYWKPPTGDEVFYLITAQSILADHDLDETNQFAGRAWLEFYPTCEEFRKGWKGFTPPGIPCWPDSKLDPEATHSDRPGTYSKHGLGLSFIIAPAYAFAGRPAVVTLLNGLAALLALNIFLLAWEASGRRWVAWCCWAPLTFGAPVFTYAFLIFPQPVGALALLYAFRRARWAALSRLTAGPVRANTPLQMIGVALCLAILPWLHILYVIPSAVVLAYLYLGGRRAGRSSEGSTGDAWTHVALFLIIGLSAGLYMARNIYLYGVPWPSTWVPWVSSASRPSDHHGFSRPLMIPVGFFGLLFDQKYGLLMYNPVYLIPIAWLCRLVWARRRLEAVWRSELVWLLAIIVPYYLIAASYSRWWGEWCPPARYLLPIAPLLTLPLARALVHARSRLLTWYCRVGATWALALSVAFVWNPILAYNWEDPKSCKVLLWFEEHYAIFRRIPLGNFFPYYVNFIEPLTPIYYVAHVAWLALAVWLGWRMMRRTPVPLAG